MSKPTKNVLLITQEIKLARILAGNNKKLRERTLKRLGKWLIERANNAPISEDVFMRLWKGLFYAMWASDKPLVQEEYAESISKLVHFNDPKTSLMFFKCFLRTMVNEWFGIDHHRIDKFLMLVRRFFRQAFHVLKDTEWDDEHVNTFREILNQTALKHSSNAMGLILHIDEIFLEELAKVSRGKIPEETVLELIQPFVQQLARLDDSRHVKHVTQHIFKYLIDQSDVGIEYKEKFHVWRRQGFPGGTMDSLEKVQINNEDAIQEEDDEDEEGATDPRAGKVDVVLPQLQFSPLKIVEMLTNLRFKNYTTSLGRKQINTLIRYFNTLSQGVYPLGATKVATLEDDGYSTDLKSSVKRLNKLDEKLSKQSKRAKKREMKQKKVKEILQEHVEKLTPESIPKIKVVKPPKQKKPVQEFTEDSEEFQKFVAKSEAKLMQEFHKKKRKRSDIPEVKTKKQKKTVATTKEDLLNVSEADLEKIPTKNANTFVRNSGMWVVEECDVPESPKAPKAPKNNDEWSKPLQNGETEYFVVSSKMKKKLKRLSHEDSPKTPKKSSKIVKNPFSTPEISKSGKKIKFSDKNHAQDFSDHLKQIMSSPGIPYDSKKKPIKPLLKPSPISSPINPFYRKFK